MDEENVPSGMAKEPCRLFFSLSFFSEDGMGLLIGRQVLDYIEWYLYEVLHAATHFQYAQFCFFLFFSAYENVISVFSRPIGTATPKPQCQGLKLGMAR